jgi:hypothetical protein
VQWDAWKGKRIGVDALGFLYKANEDHISDCLAVAELIAFWRSHDIEPVFVFDGCVPVEKRRTCTRRRQCKEWLPESQQVYVTSEDRNRVKQLLYACGVLFVNALEEADTVLAFLLKRGEIAAVVSQDLDFLARGCEHLLVPSGSDPSEWKHLCLSKILVDSQLSLDQFRTLCVLLGCDYCPSLPLPHSLLTSRVRQESLEGILKREGIRNPTLWIRASDILRGDHVAWDSMLAEKQREKWTSLCVPEPEVLTNLFETVLSSIKMEDRMYLARVQSRPFGIRKV